MTVPILKVDEYLEIPIDPAQSLPLRETAKEMNAAAELYQRARERLNAQLETLLKTHGVTDSNEIKIDIERAVIKVKKSDRTDAS